jgi:hypothetical protein
LYSSNSVWNWRKVPSKVFFFEPASSTGVPLGRADGATTASLDVEWIPLGKPFMREYVPFPLTAEVGKWVSGDAPRIVMVANASAAKGGIFLEIPMFYRRVQRV